MSSGWPDAGYGIHFSRARRVYAITTQIITIRFTTYGYTVYSTYICILCIALYHVPLIIADVMRTPTLILDTIHAPDRYFLRTVSIFCSPGRVRLSVRPAAAQHLPGATHRLHTGSSTRARVVCSVLSVRTTAPSHPCLCCIRRPAAAVAVARKRVSQRNKQRSFFFFFLRCFQSRSHFIHFFS